MSQADKKVIWCLEKAKRELKESSLHRGLREVEKNRELAMKHIAKAEHNLKAALYLEKGGFSDWSASAFFYCIYHCFLAVVRKFGYESRNQECTIAVVEMLKEEGKISISQEFIDALKIEKAEERQESNVISLRENFQYTTDLDFKEKEEFRKLIEICKKAINETRDIIAKE